MPYLPQAAVSRVGHKDMAHHRCSRVPSVPGLVGLEEADVPVEVGLRVPGRHLCYHRGGRGVGGQPREMPSAFEGRCSTDGAVALQRGGRNTIEEPDLTPGLIARARAERGDAPLSQPKRKRNRRTDRSAESRKRRWAEHCHRTHRTTSPPFSQLGKRRPRAPGGPRGARLTAGTIYSLIMFG